MKTLLFGHLMLNAHSVFVLLFHFDFLIFINLLSSATGLFIHSVSTYSFSWRHLFNVRRRNNKNKNLCTLFSSFFFSFVFAYFFFFRSGYLAVAQPIYIANDRTKTTIAQSQKHFIFSQRRRKKKTSNDERNLVAINKMLCREKRKWKSFSVNRMINFMYWHNSNKCSLSLVFFLLLFSALFIHLIGPSQF